MVTPRRTKFEYRGWSVYCFRNYDYWLRKKGFPDSYGRFCALAKKNVDGTLKMWNVEGDSLAAVEALARNRIDLGQ